MNLTMEKLKLFEVVTSNMSIIKHDGCHLGGGITPDGYDTIDYIPKLLLIGNNLNQVSKFLHDHLINVLSIIEVGTVIDCSKENTK